jgi:hypothetical protein
MEMRIIYSVLRNNGTILGKQVTEMGSSEATELLSDLSSVREIPFTCSSTISRIGRRTRVKCTYFPSLLYDFLDPIRAHKWF